MSYEIGRLAQLGERHPYKVDVTCSIHVTPTKYKKRGHRKVTFFFIFGGDKSASSGWKERRDW